MRMDDHVPRVENDGDYDPTVRWYEEEGAASSIAKPHSASMALTLNWEREKRVEYE